MWHVSARLPALIKLHACSADVRTCEPDLRTCEPDQITACSADVRDPCAERATVLPIPSFADIIYLHQILYHINNICTVKVKLVKPKIEWVFVKSYILGIILHLRHEAWVKFLFIFETINM